MKKAIFSFAFVFLVSFFFGQNHRLPLSVKTDDKITIHGFCYWQELHVKSKDTSFIHRLHSGNPDLIKNLKPGTYVLTAISLFNHHISKKVELNKKTPLIKIGGMEAFYTRIPETQTLSEKLKLNDTLYIIYSTSSNESIKEKIGITKTKAGYVAIQYVGLSNKIFQEMQFRDEFYKQVIKFETEGKKTNSPKAETAPKAEVFTIELNKEIISFIVPGENGGLDPLKAALFIVEQK
jgi:hypothetical protein